MQPASSPHSSALVPEPRNGAALPLGDLAARGVVTLVASSLARIKAQEALVPLIFYRRLFTLEPRLRTLFTADMEVQGRALLEAFIKIMGLAHEPGASEAYARALARRHATYGVRAEHFPLFCRAWLDTLGEVLAGPHDAAALGAWAEFVEGVAQVMSAEVEAVAALKADGSLRAKRRPPAPEILSRPPLPFGDLTAQS